MCELTHLQGGFFGPYTPLQQLDILADFGTKSYIVGSTNSLLLQQKDRYSDVLINLDEVTINITSPSLKSALALTAADRRWIDFLTQEVNETWDDSNPSRPKNMQYVGSEEFIRSQFEAYMLGLLSSVKYHNFLVSAGEDVSSLGADSDPATDFGQEWVEAWTKTENYRMWNAYTDTNIFGVSEPKHPCAGGLTIEDIQRRVAEQIKDLHLDERLAQGRDMLGRNIAAGREKASTMLNKLYSDVEYLRESQRRRAEDGRSSSHAGSKLLGGGDKGPSYQVDLAKAQQTVNAVGAKASAYMSSWASWAGEKRKTGGWNAAWSKKGHAGVNTTRSSGPSSPVVPIDKDYQIVSSPASHMSTSTTTSTDDHQAQTLHAPNLASLNESVLSRVSLSNDGPLGSSSTVASSARDPIPEKVAPAADPATAENQQPSKVSLAVASEQTPAKAAPANTGFRTEAVTGSANEPTAHKTSEAPADSQNKQVSASAAAAKHDNNDEEDEEDEDETSLSSNHATMELTADLQEAASAWAEKPI